MQKLKSNFIYIIIIMLPLIDIITSLCIRFDLLNISPSLIIRGVFLVLCAGYILFKKDLKYRKLNIIYYTASITFLIIYLIPKIKYLSISGIIYEISSFSKFWFFPIYLLFFISAISSNKIDINKLLRSLDINLLICTLGIIIPKLTNTAFSSYVYGNSGIVGWFYSANEISAIMSILFCLQFLNINKEKKMITKYILSILTIISLTLIGTKVVAFSLIIIIVIALIASLIKNKFNLKNKDLIYTIVIFIIGLTMTIKSSTVLNVISRIEFNVSEKNNTSSTKPTKPSTPTDTSKKPTVEKKSDTLIGTLFSGRDIYLKNTYNVFQNSNFTNKMLGLGFINDKNEVNKLIEIDIFDILFNFGIIGFIVYYTPLILFFWYGLKGILKNKLITADLVQIFLFIGLSLGISSLAGHVLGAPSVSLYLAILISIFFYLTNKGKEITESN